MARAKPAIGAESFDILLPMSQMNSTVLVVEDETDIRDLIVLHLAREGFRVRVSVA